MLCSLQLSLPLYLSFSTVLLKSWQNPSKEKDVKPLKKEAPQYKNIKVEELKMRSIGQRAMGAKLRLRDNSQGVPKECRKGLYRSKP